MATTKEFRKKAAQKFYETFCPDRIAEVDFIDFNYSVRDISIEAGTTLCGFKDPRVSPDKTTFFTQHGIPVVILGVHDQTKLPTHPRIFSKVMNVYEVLVPVPHALESVCADGIDSWSLLEIPVQVGGGGWQYKIPEPHRYLRYVPDSERGIPARR